MPLIESGSLTSGVNANDFGLPPGTALRIEMPHAALSSFVAHYHVFDSLEPSTGANEEWILPHWGAMRFIFASNPITLRVGVRHYDPLPSAALYGATSRAMELSARGGVTIGVNLTPLGWARFINTDASALRDRVTSLETVLPAGDVKALHADLAKSDRAGDVARILDHFLLGRLGTPGTDDAAIIKISAALRERNTVTIRGMAARVDLPVHRVRRLSNRHFGFAPKLLLARARFVRCYLEKVNGPGVIDWGTAPAPYFDISHFHRDSRRFFGMSPRRFAALPKPYLEAVLRAVRIVQQAHRVDVSEAINAEYGTLK